MTTPHEYFDEHHHPHLHSRGNSAMYEDLEPFANHHDAELPNISTIGRGPRGDAYVPSIDESSSDDTFVIKYTNDRTGEVVIESPNLHAGKLRIEADGLPEVGGRQDLIQPTQDSEGRYVRFYLRRNGVEHLLCETELPEGAHGSRIYVHDYKEPLKVTPSFTYQINNEDLIYSTLAPEEQPKPRIWDTVLSYIVDPNSYNAETESFKAYFASGTIYATGETTSTVVFRCMYPLSSTLAQVQADFLEEDPDSPAYIKNKDKIASMTKVEELVNQEATERAIADDNLDEAKVDKTNLPNQAYGTNPSGEPTTHTIDFNASGSTIPKRGTSGQVRVGNPSNPYDAVNLQTLNNAIDNIDIDGKQDKHDEALETTNKDIVPAINEVNNKVSRVYRPCGSVPTYDDLPTTAEPGDVYNVEDTGDNYAYTKEGTWDKLGGNVDLSQYRKYADQDVIDNIFRDQIHELDLDKVDKSTDASVAHVTDGVGNETTKQYTNQAYNNTLMARDAQGRARVYDPEYDTDIVNKRWYLNNMLKIEAGEGIKFTPKTDGTIVISLADKEAYALLKSVDAENDTLEFRYDRERSSFPADKTFVVRTYSPPSWYSVLPSITTVKFTDSFANYKPTTCRSWFENSGRLTSIEGIKNLDTSNVTSMNSMFNNCTSLTTLDVSNWDVSSVISMNSVFSDCTSLTTLDVSNWDVSSVISMNSMFNNCTSLTTLDVSNWDVSSVTNIGYMFWNCESLTALDVSNWDVSSVTAMYGMFKSCKSLTALDVSNWDVSSVTDMNSMFNDCTSLTALDVSNWDVSSVTHMNFMFNYCTSLTTLDVSNWDVSSVTNMNSMFYDSGSLTRIYSNSNWAEMPNITESNSMFRFCTKLPHFDGTKLDKTYAYPDNGTTGYFTPKPSKGE